MKAEWREDRKHRKGSWEAEAVREGADLGDEFITMLTLEPELRARFCISVCVFQRMGPEGQNRCLLSLLLLSHDHIDQYSILALEIDCFHLP